MDALKPRPGRGLRSGENRVDRSAIPGQSGYFVQGLTAAQPHLRHFFGDHRASRLEGRQRAGKVLVHVGRGLPQPKGGTGEVAPGGRSDQGGTPGIRGVGQKLLGESEMTDGSAAGFSRVVPLAGDSAERQWHSLRSGASERSLYRHIRVLARMNDAKDFADNRHCRRPGRIGSRHDDGGIGLLPAEHTTRNCQSRRGGRCSRSQVLAARARGPAVGLPRAGRGGHAVLFHEGEYRGREGGVVGCVVDESCLVGAGIPHSDQGVNCAGQLAVALRGRQLVQRQAEARGVQHEVDANADAGLGRREREVADAAQGGYASLVSEPALG